MTELTLVGLLVVHLLLTGLPFVAACLLAAYWGVRHPAVILAVGLAGSGALAMLGFWAFYATPTLGKALGFVSIAAAIAAILFTVRSGRLSTEIYRGVAIPVLLWGFGSAFVVFFGFLHGGSNTAIATSAERFLSSQMATDNDIPQFFASWFYVHGHHGVPPVYPGDWLASDRPPLQLGYVDLQRPFGWDQTGLNYQIVGVVLQQMWIIGLWALLVATGLAHRTRALAMVAVLASGFALVNGFYVWPKLLPAAMLLAATALVITPLWSEHRHRASSGALIAALFALAMLGHGSSVFAIIPLALFALWRGVPNLRWLGAAAAVAIVLYVPWSEYQAHGDPPGNRLTKWMLAGDISTNRPGLKVSTDIKDAYRQVGLGGAVHNKVENLVTTVGGGPMAHELKSAADSVEHGHLKPAIFQLRGIAFFDLFPSLGLYLLVPLIMIVGRIKRRYVSAEWSFSLAAVALSLVGVALWCIILFGNTPSRAIIHQGSYLIPILLIVAAVAGAQAISARLALALTGVTVLSTLALYGPSFTPPVDSRYSPYAIALCAISLMCFAAVAFAAELIPLKWRAGARRPRMRSAEPNATSTLSLNAGLEDRLS